MAKRLDLSGMDIGDLHVITEAKIENNTTYWHCICKCGKNVTLTTRKIKSKNTVNCGFCNKKRKDKTTFIK